MSEDQYEASEVALSNSDAMCRTNEDLDGNLDRGLDGIGEGMYSLPLNRSDDDEKNLITRALISEGLCKSSIDEKSLYDEENSLDLPPDGPSRSNIQASRRNLIEY